MCPWGPVNGTIAYDGGREKRLFQTGGKGCVDRDRTDTIADTIPVLKAGSRGWRWGVGSRGSVHK